MGNKLWRWFVLALPIFVLVGGIVRGERALRTGDLYRFDIGGYDPRDLLRGRYLQFRVEEQWGEAHDMSRREADCACLERTGVKTPPTLRAASCSFAQQSCDGFITREALRGLNRFYVPEARASELEQTLQAAAARDAAQIEVSVDREGNAAIVDLLIEGEPILD